MNTCKQHECYTLLIAAIDLCMLAATFAAKLLSNLQYGTILSGHKTWELACHNKIKSKAIAKNPMTPGQIQRVCVSYLSRNIKRSKPAIALLFCLKGYFYNQCYYASTQYQFYIFSLSTGALFTCQAICAIYELHLFSNILPRLVLLQDSLSYKIACTLIYACQHNHLVSWRLVL